MASAEDDPAPTDTELWLVLEAVITQEGVEFSCPEELPADRRLPVINELLLRHWIEGKPTRNGSGRLMFVTDVRPTSSGRRAVSELRRTANATSPESPPLPLTEKRHRRAILMTRLYEYTDGSELKSISSSDLANMLGWTADEVTAVLTFLEREHLVSFVGFGPQVSITHWGVVEVEASLERPDEPTEHFPPHATVIVHGDVYGSQIQAGTISSVQNQVAGQDPQAVRDYVTEFRRLLETEQLDESTHGIATADLATIDAQLLSPAPNEAVIRESLRSLRAISEGVVASGAWIGLFELAKHVHF